ncbi:MAG: isochorismatase family protein [Solirubrobacterales bacterium]
MTDEKESQEQVKFGGSLARGSTPAVIVVDLTIGFTDPKGTFGSDLDDVVEQTVRVLEAARERGHLVIYSTVGYDPSLRDVNVPIQKAPAATKMLNGMDASILDPRLGRREEEVVIHKRAPSALFGTSVPALLLGNHIDTVVLCGAVTSGCIRATCVDLYSYEMPTLIPLQCVGDREQAPHEANLYDMQAKYADVIDVEDAIGYLRDTGADAG